MRLKKTGYGNLIGAICIVAMFFIGSCSSPTQIPIDEKSITEFHLMNDKVINRLQSQINLFIDYSTCMADAVTSSEFFSQIRPRITGMNPTLYGIKGNNIDLISSDNVTVNVELNKITEIPYANIRDACKIICSGNNQAILITDGEYWTVGIGEMTDLPYLLDPFTTWLSKGFSIYIYVEDYIENYHGLSFPKKRFYFIFTDDKLKNNIYQDLKRAFQVSPLGPTLKIFRLSNNDIQLTGKLSVYDQIESTLVTDRGITAFDIESEWENLDMYVLNATNSEDGAAIEGGNYLMRGLKMSPDPISFYTYPELDIKVYNVSEGYLNYKKPDLDSCEVRDIFILDKDLYRNTGEIGIKMSKHYSNSLKEETENLLRIDIIAKETKKRISMTDLVWKSLSTNATNISVYQSILQTIQKPEIDPALCNKVLYTIYLKTKAYKI